MFNIEATCNAAVAQLVEHSTNKAAVVSSTLTLDTNCLSTFVVSKITCHEV